MKLDLNIEAIRLNIIKTYSLNISKIGYYSKLKQLLKMSDIPQSELDYSAGKKLFQNGEFHEAIVEFKKTIEVNPNHRNAWHFIGICYYKTKQYQKAIESWEHGIELDPTHHFFPLNIGISYHSNKEYVKAIDYLIKAIELDPKNRDAWYFLGSACMMSKQYQNALEAFKKGIEFHPEDKDMVKSLMITRKIIKKQIKEETKRRLKEI